MSIQTVKLSQILPDPDTNSRHHSAYEIGLKQLADNIAAIGLILPIAVRPIGDGLYRILDGHRRHQALTMIHSGKLEETDVPVLVREADNADARTLSLAANIMRLPLHAADQYEAFAAMLDEGLSREEIAARFALPVKDVDKRLALGRIAKPFLDAYRKDELKVETIQILTGLSMSRQFEVLKLVAEQGRGYDDWRIRQLVNDDAIFSNNPIAKFVGIEAYEAAGGRVERNRRHPRVHRCCAQCVGWCAGRVSGGRRARWRTYHPPPSAGEAKWRMKSSYHPKPLRRGRGLHTTSGGTNALTRHASLSRTGGSGMS